MIATRLLRDEFFTIFGDLDMKSVQQDSGQSISAGLSDAGKRNRRYYQMSYGWWRGEDALRQLYDTWPRCPHLHCLVLLLNVPACPMSASQRPWCVLHQKPTELPQIIEL